MISFSIFVVAAVTAMYVLYKNLPNMLQLLEFQLSLWLVVAAMYVL